MVYVGKRSRIPSRSGTQLLFLHIKNKQVGSEASEAYEEDFEKSSEARQILRDTAEKSHKKTLITVANSQFPGSIWDLVLS